MEGKRYKCTWKKARDETYFVGLVSAPRITATGATFLEATENLSLQIIAEYGDGEAVLEFIAKTPSHAVEERYGFPAIVWLSGNERMDPPLNLAQAYSGKTCKSCGSPTGSRTADTLEFEKLTALDGAWFEYGRCLFHVLSEDFVRLLNMGKSRRVQFKEVTCTRRTKRRFYEVQGTPLAPFARNLELEKSMRDAVHYWGSRCETCGHTTDLYGIDGSIIRKFVRRRALPKRLPDIFLLGNDKEVKICMKQDLWLKLLKQKGTKGIVSTRIGVF